MCFIIACVTFVVARSNLLPDRSVIRYPESAVYVPFRLHC
jgi:hypothetical protein